VSDKAECGSSAREQHGCNVVGASCHCGTSSVCPGDLPPFTFASHTECEINLKAMLSELHDILILKQIKTKLFKYY
jgi:hypothetical protein